MKTRFLLSLFPALLFLTTGCLMTPPNTSTQIQPGIYEGDYDSLFVRFTLDSPEFTWEYYEFGVLKERQWGTWNYQKTQNDNLFSLVVGHLRLVNDSDEIFSGDSSAISSLGNLSYSVTASNPGGFTVYYEVVDTAAEQDGGSHGLFAYLGSYSLNYAKK